jgi:FtsP/CotA-like multicopper oxidase with cupredoxin domain
VAQSPPRALRQIEARPGKARLSGGGDTSILGFEGSTPGPVLRYQQGDELAVRFLNKLDQPATIHWHGLRGDNAMEGVAPLTQAAVAPGGSYDYRRKLADHGLFCYRPSVYGATPELVGRGLKGLLIVDEPAPLPADADLLLVLDDWRLDDAGQVVGGFDDPAAARGVGRIGPLLCVNGKAAPALQSLAPGARVRLRLANLSNARIMVLSLAGAQPFVIAIDGQPCDAFEPIKRSIPVAPGARFELMFDMPETEGAKANVILRGPNGEDRDLFVAEAKALTEGRGVELILDMVGGEYIDKNYDVAAIDGRIVQIAFLGGPKATVNFAKLMMKRLHHTGSTLRPRTNADKAAMVAAIEAKVMPLFRDGKVKPLMDQSFPLEKAADAHARMETSQHIGKIVLVV